MTTRIARFEGYVLPRARRPVIDNLIFDDLGQAVLAKHNELFRGVRGIEDTTQYKPNQPLSYSNTPRNLSYNSLLREETNGNIHLLTPTQIVQHWNDLPERNSTYADTNAIIIYPNVGPNEDLRQRVLNILPALRKTSIQIPFLISGLGVERADNDYGFTFVGTDYMKVTEAPYATADGKVRYTEQGLIRSEQGVSIWTPSDQSGLRRVHRNWDGGLGLGDGGLLDSYEDGRVQVIQDPLGSEKNLETKV